MAWDKYLKYDYMMNNNYLYCLTLSGYMLFEERQVSLLHRFSNKVIVSSPSGECLLAARHQVKFPGPMSILSTVPVTLDFRTSKSCRFDVSRATRVQRHGFHVTGHGFEPGRAGTIREKAECPIRPLPPPRLFLHLVYPGHLCSNLLPEIFGCALEGGVEGC